MSNRPKPINDLLKTRNSLNQWTSNFSSVLRPDDKVKIKSQEFWDIIEHITFQLFAVVSTFININLRAQILC